MKTRIQNHTLPVSSQLNWLSLLVFFCITLMQNVAAGTDVYVTRDKDGNPVFSDQPSDAAEKIQVQEVMTIPAETAPPPSPGTKSKSDYQYKELRITQPLNDSAVRENSGRVTISVVLSPRLRSGDSLVISMDGQEVSRGKSRTVSIDNVDRGTHNISAEVISAEDRSLISADPVSFTLLRFRP